MQVYGKTMILSGADLEEASIKLLKAHQMDPTPASATQIIKCQLLRSVHSPVKSLGVCRMRDRSLTHIFFVVVYFCAFAHSEKWEGADSVLAFLQSIITPEAYKGSKNKSVTKYSNKIQQIL